MDLKLALLFCFSVFIAVNGQYDTQHLIDQTKHLQDIEKYGTNYNYTRPMHNSVYPIYPQLSNFTDPSHGSHYNNQRSNGSAGDSQSHLYTIQPYGLNATERFLNKTISTMSQGVCIKEVPTVSLLKRNEVVVAGNGSDSTLSRIQVCCEGYQRNVHNFRKCDPICENCVNGFCSSPGNCDCYPDHVKNLAGFCLPTCPIGCGNGHCRENNLCVCNEGYILERNGKFCIPYCSGGCQHGNCTAPQTCTCDFGFSLNSEGKCGAVCSRGCKNGDCVSPEVCQCQKGYAAVDGVCQPICSRGCENGVCVSPEVCECPERGWSLDSTGSKCVASCDKTCLNGICSGPNQCTCRSGYALDSFDAFRCVPKCNPPCVNGVCSGPNMCLCYQGYVKDRSVKGSQICIKT